MKTTILLLISFLAFSSFAHAELEVVGYCGKVFSYSKHADNLKINVKFEETVGIKIQGGVFEEISIENDETSLYVNNFQTLIRLFSPIDAMYHMAQLFDESFFACLASETNIGGNQFVFASNKDLEDVITKLRNKLE